MGPETLSNWTSGALPSTPADLLSLGPARCCAILPHKEEEDMSDRGMGRAYLQTSNCTFRTGGSTAGGRTWKNRRESTDARLKSVWHGRLTDDFKGPVMNMTGGYGNSLWIQLPFLSRLYGPFRSVFFIYLFLFPATPGVRFGRWRCGSCRSPLDVGICGTCIFMSAWWYSTWQLLILAPLILRSSAQKSPPPGVFYLSTYILIQSICLCSHLVENLIEQMGVT